MSTCSERGSEFINEKSTNLPNNRVKNDHMYFT